MFKNNERKRNRIKEFPVVFGNHGVLLRGKVLLPEETNARALPGAILCHGFGASSRATEPSARILANKGIATLIFDLRGHGSSEGVVDNRIIDDITDAWYLLSQLPEVDARRIALIGHSLGAMSAIMAATRIHSPHALVALSCPPEVDSQLLKDEPLNIGRWGQNSPPVLEHPKHGAFPWLKGIAGLLCQVWMYFHGYRVRVHWQEFFEAFPLMKMSQALRELKECYKLFVFCEGDKVTPYQKSASIYQAACEPKAILVVKRGFHSAPLLSRSLRSQWINWTVQKLTVGES
ncbi:MAG TPA: alpha/beta fold hydrolase [Dehalococcoidia bacterium]|nr:alpha/beta fold hydrolase [Dehalococcoidia bacterium]